MPETNRREFIKLALMTPVLAGLPFRLVQSSANSSAPSSRPNVVMILFDTVSAKHMSLYGYPRETTPNLTRFASKSTVFHRHYASGNFTSPGTSGLLTGASPWTQRAFNFQGTVTREFEHRNLFRVFEDAGYRRVVYTHNWLVVQLLNQFQSDIDAWKPMRELCVTDTELSDRIFANDHDVALTTERVSTLRTPMGTVSLFLSMLKRSLDTHDQRLTLAKYKKLFPRGLPTNNETTLFLLEDAIDWIKSQLPQSPRPFLGYFHLLPPHEPYNARAEFIGRFDDEYQEIPKPAHPLSATLDEPALALARRRYDEYLSYADSEFGRLYDFMRDSGTLDNSFVIFTSDHGQMLERGTRGHLNPLLYEAITRIPLIVSSPGQTKRVDVTSPTSALDVMPTLARVAGQAVPTWCEGQILPTLGGEATAGRSIYTLEAKSNGKQLPITKSTLSMVKDQYKLISYQGYEPGYNGVFELYDLDKDPEEIVDLYPSKPSVAEDMRDELLTGLEEANRSYRRA